MFEALERMPRPELEGRWAHLRKVLPTVAPNAGGILVFSKVSIYYCTGTMASGVFWLPLEGEPVLLLRRASDRARLESSLTLIEQFRSYSDLSGILKEAGVPLSDCVAAEMGGLSWSLGELFRAKLSDVTIVPGDLAIAKARSYKSEWELAKMRLCGQRHHASLVDILPEVLRPGMTEREVSHACWDAFFSLGHMGHMRMNAFGEEVFLGHVSAGDSGNYPSSFNGPLGLRGEHPAIPFGGYAGKVWKKGEPLALDCGFELEGYITDKTQVYWGGPESSIPDEVRRGHDFCIEVQNWIAERMTPDHSPTELYEHCVEWAKRDGFAEGFMALGNNKVAFIGHGIGLTVDGWPVVAKGFDEPFVVGQTLALEPKYGIPGLGMVGVENTFEVTPTGGKCITGDQYDMICIK